MSRQRLRLIPLDDFVATYQEPGSTPTMMRYAEVAEWVHEPDRYIYDEDSRVVHSWSTDRTKEVPNPFRGVSLRTRWSWGLRLYQPKTITLAVWEVVERVDRFVVWTDELIGPQGRKETVQRQYEWLRSQ